jgi:uncharacterized phage protein gp47/JayE
MAFGVTSAGFVPMRLSDIKTALETALKAAFGDINVDPTSVFGQFIGVMSKMGADWWEVAEDVYLSQYPSSASGVALDNVLSLSGLTRLSAAYSQVICQLTGTASTVVPVGSQIESTNGDLFALLAEVTIGASPTDGTFVAVVSGAVSVPAGTLTTIVTPVSGWTSVTNADAGTMGRAAETDAEARQRREAGLSIIGAGTVNAIQSRIMENVNNVTAVAVFENRTDITDADGRPPHSFEVVVFGGADADIAAEIWATKPAGIQTYGSSYVDITDSNGDTQRIYFSRPVQQYVHVEVTITYYAEEAFPIDGEAQIKAAIYAYGLSLALGKDLIIQRWQIPVYDIPGIATVTIRHDVTDNPGDTPSWSTSNLVIGSTSIANMDEDRITVVLP